MEHGIPPTHEFDKNYVIDGKIMLFSVFGLAIAVSAVFFVRGHCRRSRSRRHDYSGAGGTTTQGVDLSALKSLPTFAYSSATDDPLLECAVCLSQFQNDEPGRVLPRCAHTFHAGCIDTWLHSHSSCPLCRVPVQTGGAPVREPGRVKEEAGCSSASPPEPSFSLLMGIASLV